MAAGLAGSMGVVGLRGMRGVLDGQSAVGLALVAAAAAFAFVLASGIHQRRAWAFGRASWALMVALGALALGAAPPDGLLGWLLLAGAGGLLLYAGIFARWLGRGPAKPFLVEARALDASRLEPRRIAATLLDGRLAVAACVAIFAVHVHLVPGRHLPSFPLWVEVGARLAGAVATAGVMWLGLFLVARPEALDEVASEP